MTPGRANQLAHHHPLGSVDDEGALVGHHREVPHEDRLLLDLASARVHEPRPHEDRRGVGHVLFFALLHRELRRWTEVWILRIELELETQLAGEVLDRADVVERLGEAALEEPLEGVPLDGDEVRQGQGFVNVGKRKTFRAVGPCRQRPTPPSCMANGATTGYCDALLLGAGDFWAHMGTSQGSTTTAAAVVRGRRATRHSSQSTNEAKGETTATRHTNRARREVQPRTRKPPT